MTLTPTELCNNRIAHHNSTMYVSNGIKVIRYNDTYYSDEEFNQTFPVNGLKVKVDNELKGKNPDGRKKFLYS